MHACCMFGTLVTLKSILSQSVVLLIAGHQRTFATSFILDRMTACRSLNIHEKDSGEASTKSELKQSC